MTHRPDICKGTIGQGAQRSLGSSCDDHIGKIIADVTERLAESNRAAGAAIGIGGSNTLKSAGDGDIGVGRSTENLKRQHRTDRLESSTDKSVVFFLRIGDAAKSRSKTNSPPRVGYIRTPIESAVSKCKQGAGNRKLGIAVKTPE